MSKQDRTHSRTPADTESKFLLNLDKSFAEIMGIATDARTKAENARTELLRVVADITKEITENGATIKLVVDSGLVDADGNVQASIIIEAINDESSAKIKADNILFEGQKLDIKVDDTNIDGKLTAKVLDIDNIKAKDVDISGTVTANEGEIGGWILGEYDIPVSETNTIKEKALYSGKKEYRISDLVWYTAETWLTARGAYCVYKYYSNSTLDFINYYSSMWWELLKKTNTSEKWKFTLDNGEIVEKEMFVN